MNYSDYFINSKDVILYTESKTVPEKLNIIWNDVLRRIKDEDIRNEAEAKGFEIVDNPDMDDDNIATYKMFSVPEASQELKEYFEEHVYYFVVFLKP